MSYDDGYAGSRESVEVYSAADSRAQLAARLLFYAGSGIAEDYKIKLDMAHAARELETIPESLPDPTEDLPTDLGFVRAIIALDERVANRITAERFGWSAEDCDEAFTIIMGAMAQGLEDVP